MTAISTFAKKLIKRKYPVGPGRIVVWSLALLGVAVIITRWALGLGATTNMTDGRGWGIWISFDILTGIGVSAGAFTLAAIVYIFNHEKYHEIVRATILTAFIGYFLAACTLLVDLGFPYRIWHLIIYWNVHSPLFEVGWCVMLYLAVLALEFSPAVFETWGWKVPLKIVRSIQIPLVVTGIVLSCMHQSSLGTLWTILPYRVHPLWYSMMAPVLFITHAMCAGLAMTVLESHNSAYSFGYKFEKNVIGGLVKLIPWILGLYLLERVIDVVAFNKWQYLFGAGSASIMWWFEILAGVVAPVVLFSMEKVRKNRFAMLWSAGLLLFGFVLNRFNISLFFFDGAPYMPSFIEIATSVGLVCIGITIYDLAARLFPFLPEPEGQKTAAVPAHSS